MSGEAVDVPDTTTAADAHGASGRPAASAPAGDGPVPSGLVSWIVIGLSTTLWLAHLVGMAVLAEGDCARWDVGVLHGLTVGLFLPTAALTLLAWKRRRGSDGEVFLARLAVWTGGINSFIILAEWVPVFFLSACGS